MIRCHCSPIARWAPSQLHPCTFPANSSMKWPHVRLHNHIDLTFAHRTKLKPMQNRQQKNGLPSRRTNQPSRHWWTSLHSECLMRKQLDELKRNVPTHQAAVVFSLTPETLRRHQDCQIPKRSKTSLPLTRSPSSWGACV